MFGLGTPELLIILVVIVMFFGIGKLPDVAKQLGGGVRSFQKSLRGEDEDEADEKEDADAEKKTIKED